MTEVKLTDLYEEDILGEKPIAYTEDGKPIYPAEKPQEYDYSQNPNVKVRYSRRR